MEQTSSTDVLSKAFAVRQILNSYGIGHNGTADCNCLVGPEPFRISEEEVAKLALQGLDLQLWIYSSIQLCNMAYGDWPELAWVAKLVENGMQEKVVAMHRKAHESGKVKLPLFARPDMSSVGVAVEVQTPGSGWGYQTAIHSTLEKSCWPGLLLSFREAIRLATGYPESPSAYILYNDPFKSEVEYFCRECKRVGINVELFFRSAPNPRKVRFVRRPPLEDLLEYENGGALIEAYLAGQVWMEPPPSLLFDQKISTAFPFHPQLRQYYPNSVRELFPETHLVQRNLIPVFGGEEVSWEQFAAMSRSKRQFILKFGGAKKGMRAGGKAVYNLSDCNQKEVSELIEVALRDYEERHLPWLIQKRVQEKYLIQFLDHLAGEIVDKDYYAVFRPMYIFPPEEAPQIVAFTGLFRKEWKVHGASDAVILPVEVG